MQKEHLMNSVLEKLDKRKTFGNLRKLHVSQGLIDFASNDYLGLAKSQNLIQRVFNEWEHHRSTCNFLGSTGSRLLTGNSSYAQALEDRIALFHGYEAGLIYNCGYMANVGLITTVAGIDDTIIFDVNVHASCRDGIRLSRAHGLPFKHNDLDHLENRLKSCAKKGNRYICIESIYSTDGSIAPINEISLLAEHYGAHLIVDEAHAVGVIGPNGRGLVAEYGLTNKVFAQVNTFGKALGTCGAIVLGSNTLKQALINFSRPYIYTTALPFHVLAAIKCSYDLFPTLDNERSWLQQLIYKAHLGACKTHIQSIKIKGNKPVQMVMKMLAVDGFDVRPFMSPTIQKGQELLRICFHAFNTEHETTMLLERITHHRSTINEYC